MGPNADFRAGTRHRGGFALVELSAIVAVGAVLAAMLLIMGDSSRRSARLGEDLSNLRQFGTITRSYAADYADLYWTFSWRAGNNNSQFPDLNNSSSDTQAAADQAVDIIRRRSSNVGHPRITGWVPHILYSPLVLADYLDQSLPMRMFASSADESQLQWQSNPLLNRLPYSASWRPTPVFYSSPSSGVHALRQGSTQNLYTIGPAVAWGDTFVSDVTNPSQKVFMNDQFQRHFGTRQPHFAFSESRVAILLADGSAGVRLTSDANDGWQPHLPASPEPTRFDYAGTPNDPPIPPGLSPLGLVGHYRWTRGGLGGRDFGGPEVWP